MCNFPFLPLMGLLLLHPSGLLEACVFSWNAVLLPCQIFFSKLFLRSRNLEENKAGRWGKGQSRVALSHPRFSPFPQHRQREEMHQPPVRGQAVGRETQSAAGAATGENKADESKRIDNATHRVSVVRTRRASSLRHLCAGHPTTVSLKQAPQVSEDSAREGWKTIAPSWIIYCVGGAAQSKHRKQLRISWG